MHSVASCSVLLGVPPEGPPVAFPFRLFVNKPFLEPFLYHLSRQQGFHLCDHLALLVSVPPPFLSIKLYWNLVLTPLWSIKLYWYLFHHLFLINKALLEPCSNTCLVNKALLVSVPSPVLSMNLY